MPVNLKSFEKKIRVRNLKPDDFDQVVALQQRCFPTLQSWTREQWDSQQANFPDGQICVVLSGKIVASSCSLIVDSSDYQDFSAWKDISDGGYIRNHNEEGDTLYGIEIMVDPKHRGMKLARRLYDARKELCRQRNLARILVGGRIPGYASVAKKITPQRYVERVMRNEMVDPVLTTQVANGFQLKQLVRDYMPSDEDSAGFATCLEWPNLEFTPERMPMRVRRVDPVRITVVQWRMREIDSFEDFARQCEFFVDVASDARSDFVLFPELFTLQLLCLVRKAPPGTAARALAGFTPRYLEFFQQLSVRYNVNILGGSTFTLEDDGVLHNTAFLFKRDGTLGRQHKIHVTPNEAHWWGVQGGSTVEVMETDRGKVAIPICYDVEFPELARVAAARGALLFLVPFNTQDRHGYLRVRLCAQARCIENQVYVAAAGCAGNLPFVENADIHYAQSGIYTPSDIPFARDGVAAETAPNVETVLTHDLDLELLRRARRNGTVRNWNDRRLDLYQLHWGPPTPPS